MSEVTEAETTDDEAVADEEPELRYGAPFEVVGGQVVLHPHRSGWRELAEALIVDAWNMCMDVTAVDYLSYGVERSLPAGVVPERFEVIASFISYERRERIRARAQVPADDPTIASLYPVYPGIDFQEREVFDLMGITFEGHPDLSRILMPEQWEGHPLRKDYAVGAIPVQFKAGGGTAESGANQ